MGLFGKKKKKKQQMRSPPPQQQRAPPPPKPDIDGSKASVDVDGQDVRQQAPAPPPPAPEQPPEPEPPVVEEPPVEQTEEAPAEPIMDDAENVAPEAPPMETPAEGAGGIPEDLDPEALKEKHIADLMTLKGVGRKRAEKLWAAGYSSAAEVADATLDELAAVDGFSQNLAEAVKIELGEQTFEEDVEADSEMDMQIESEVVEANVEDTGTEDDVSARILQWSVDGYEVDELEEMAKGDRDNDFQNLYEETAEAILDIEDMKDELAEMNITGMETEVEELMDLMAWPSKIEEIDTKFEAMKKGMGMRDVKHDLLPLAEIDDLAPKVNAILSRLEGGEPVETLKPDIADIKRAYREDFFLSQMAEQIEKAAPIAVKKAPVLKNVIDEPEGAKKPMEVEDLFLLHSPSYRLVSHMTNRQVGEDEKQEIFTELKAVRSFVRHNDKFKPGELNIIKFGDKIALIQEGKASLITMVVKGDVNVWSKKLIGKVLTMIEKDEGDILSSWDGDANKLPGAKKNMTALMYACVRLGKQGGN